MSDNNCTLTKSRGAIGSRAQALLLYTIFSRGDITKMGLGEAGILYTISLILGTILLEAFSFEGEDYLGNKGSSSSGRRVFHGIW